MRTRIILPIDIFQLFITFCQAFNSIDISAFFDVSDTLICEHVKTENVDLWTFFLSLSHQTFFLLTILICEHRKYLLIKIR